MNKADTIKAFFERFMDRVYEASTVPNGTDRSEPQYPYLTYQLVDGAWGTGESAMQVDLWYRSKSLGKINAKTEEIAQAIGLGGIVLPCTGGAIWIKKGSPFAQQMGDPNDDMVKRKYINVTVEFFTQ